MLKLIKEKIYKTIYLYKIIFIYWSYKKYSSSNKMKDVFYREIKRTIYDIIQFI